MLSRTPEFVEIVKEIASAYDYSIHDLGIYIQPLEDMRACQMNFILPYNSEDDQEIKIVKKIYTRAIVEIFNKGGYFNRVYDGIKDVVYTVPRVQGYVNYARRIKSLFDPNWILSPEKLCF